MDDCVSIKSNDSTTTSDEYEFVPLTSNLSKVSPTGKNEPPLLKIAGNGDLDHLQKCLGEMLNEENMANIKIDFNQECVTKDSANDFLDVAEEEQLEPLADVYQDCTFFGCISYLGSAAVNAPKSKTEIMRNMAILNEQSSDQAIKVSLSIPNFANGVVVLYDANNNSVMARYDVQRIMFYDNGAPKSNESAVFAFTYWHGESQESSLFQCHVFRCDIPEAVRPVSLCFGKAFQKPPGAMTNSKIYPDQTDGTVTYSKSVQNVVFEVGLEVKEDDGKGNFTTVSRDGSALKLRNGVGKQICLSIQQILSKSHQELEIMRCFGVLVSPGWGVKMSDMRLLDMISERTRSEEDENQKTFVVLAKWDPKETLLENSNLEASKIRLTVAVDLVIKQIKEPVRLTIETQYKIGSPNSLFWSFSKGLIFNQFILFLKEVPSRNGSSEPGYEVSNIERSTILHNTWSNWANLIKSASTTSLEETTPTDEFSDTDEPMLSGTGEVSREWTDRELGSWNELLPKWTDTNERPKQLTKLVQQGIPEALRGMVWQQLANVDKDDDLLNQYRILISQECNAELVIKKDIHRTFPAHDYFKEAGGVGQDTLFNISKAYAVYDTEIGYCQGLTFIAASLLLHMPEEQAFCVLVRLMYDYKLRDLYKDGFEILKLKLYQLDRLLEEKDPELWQHFRKMGVETHMFAHHWFLTLCTARFPLYFVFSILDIVLVQGLDTIFQIALALLTHFKEELLKLDFENIVKYVQVTLPKKCRSHKVAREIVNAACKCKIKQKKLTKYESEFAAMNVREEQAQNTVAELEKTRQLMAKMEEEKRLLISELSQTKQALLIETEKAQNESKRNANIISEYKQICQRLDREQTNTNALIDVLQKKIANCDRCSAEDESTSHMNGIASKNSSTNDEDVNLVTKVKELELELAQTKLALVEAECRNEDLTHRLNSTNAELHNVRHQYPPWLHKTLSSIKEVTANKRTVSSQNVANKLFNMTKTEPILN